MPCHLSNISLHFLALYIGVPLVGAQNLAIPSAWPNASSNFSRNVRGEIANDAATSMHTNINPLDNLGVAVPRVQYFSSFFSVLALQDYYSGNSSWSSVVVNGLQAYYQQRGVYGGFPDVYSDPIYWALTFFYAYRTYKQQFLLDMVVSIYNTTYTEAFITPGIADSGSGAGRNVSFSKPSNCTNGELFTKHPAHNTLIRSSETISGGVFVNKDLASDTSISAATVAPFMTLSAYLFEQTEEPFYQQTAQLSFDFMLNYLWNGTVVTNGLANVDTCEPNLVLDTENQGWFIEGLSIWANVTKNSTLESLLEAVVSNVTVFSAWTLRDGVVSEDSDISDSDAIYKGIFIRGLAEARMRFPNTDLATYIESYIMVQYNSILSNAQSAAPNTSFYSTSWFGPPTSSFSAAGNIAALDVLNAAYSFVSPENSSNASSTASPTSTNPIAMPSASHRRSSSISGIIGGVIGGTCFVVVTLAFLLIWRRQRRRTIELGLTSSAADQNHAHGSGHTNAPRRCVEPYFLPSTHNQSSKWARFYGTRHDGVSPPSASIHTGESVQTNTIAVAGSSDEFQGSDLPVAARPTLGDGDDDIMRVSYEQADSAELPTLVHRLYNLVQGHQRAELPPRYER